MPGENHSRGWGKVTCMGLAETTALLRMLNEEPDPPSENLLPAENDRFESQQQTRVLTLKHERDLVDNLAFLLSAFGDDPKRVIAVCVEESWGGDSMMVRMAMNAGDMVMVTRGLRKMTRVLEQEAAQVSRDTNSNILIREVISFSRDRIFSRLRSRHAQCSRATGKSPGIPRLAAAISLLNAAETTIRDPNWDALKTRVRALSDDFSELEHMPQDRARSQAGHEVLIRILQNAHRISTSHDLITILSKLENTGTFGPDNKRGLPMVIGKLGRYVSASEWLLHYARKLSIFKSIRIESVKILPLTPASAQINGHASSSSSILGQYLQSPFSVEKLESQFRGPHTSLQQKLHDRISQGSYKVHAEIQLLHYYSLLPSPSPHHLPRVICSTKSACFLCDLFVKLHGQFYVARTHGRLYDKWMLPDFSTLEFPTEKGRKELCRVVERFDEALKKRVRLTLCEPKGKLRHPNESVFFPQPEPTPSVLSVESERTVGRNTGMAKAESSSIMLFTRELEDRTAEMVMPENSPMTIPSTEEFGSRRNSSSTAGTLFSEPKSGYDPNAPLPVKLKDISPRASRQGLRTMGSTDLVSDAHPKTRSESIPYDLDKLATPQGTGAEIPTVIQGDPTTAKSRPDITEQQLRSVTPSLSPIVTQQHIIISPSHSAANLDLPALQPSAPARDKITPSPSPPHVRTSHLTQGQTAWHNLAPKSPSIRLTTPHVHLTLAYDWLIPDNPTAASLEALPLATSYRVRAKWLNHNDAVLATEGIDVGRMERGEENVVENGAVRSEGDLFVRRKGDVVCIKFLVGMEGGPGN